MVSISRHILVAGTLALLAFTVLVAFVSPPLQVRVLGTFDTTFRSAPKTERQLHLLLPATASNLNLCRLLLSGTISGWPEPILIGWEGDGSSHLFKISETLAYLRALDPSEDDSLVMVLDAYDV